MRGRIMLAAAAATVLSALAANAADAAVVTYTYAGEVNGGYDTTGVFGDAGRELGGLAFTAVFRRDTSVVGATFEETTYGTRIYGSGASNPVTGSLTIDGVTWNFRPQYGTQEQYDQTNACGLDCDYERFTHATNAFIDGTEGPYYVFEIVSLMLGAEGLGANVLPSRDLGTLPSLGTTAALDWFGEFDIQSLVLDTRTGDRLFDALASGGLSVQSLTVDMAAVPEPATWTLMILGLGGAGAVLRRRRAPGWPDYTSNPTTSSSTASP